MKPMWGMVKDINNRGRKLLVMGGVVMALSGVLGATASWAASGCGTIDYGAAKRAYDQNRYNQALAITNKAIDCEQRAGGYYLRGLIKSEGFQDYQGALLDMNKAFALKGTNIPGNWYASRATIYRNLGRYNSALWNFNEALRRDPKDGTSWNNRGMLKHALRDHEGALSDLQQALALEPNDPEVLRNVGTSYAVLGDTANALQYLNQAKARYYQLSNAKGVREVNEVLTQIRGY